MASNSTSKAAEEAKHAAEGVAKKVTDAIDANREKVADAIDETADNVTGYASKAPGRVKDSSKGATDKLHEAASYVRQNNAREMGLDAMNVARQYPVTSIIAFGALVVGGSMLVAAMLDEDQTSGSSSGSPLRLSSAVSSLGPKGSETVTRIRDAAVQFALDKIVEAADELWPGFKQKYEKG